MSIQATNNCKETIENVSDIQEQLFNSVISGAYENALKLIDQLYRAGHIQTINNIVSRLLYNGTNNLMDYAYRLWLNNYQEIVIGYFPPAFKRLINGHHVKITNKRYGLPMKLQIGTDGVGDRRAWGDGAKLLNNRMNWTFSTIWKDNTLYFKILNSEYRQYLKLEVQEDSAGDRAAFGSDESDTFRHEWHLRPTMYEGQLLFYITNRKYGHVLKLGAWQDSINHRMVWSHGGSISDHPLEYGWVIEQW